jgi:predicted nucleic acid-binding Zn ribbon protein
VPVYVFSCPVCNGENELLLKLGDTAARPCPTERCEGTAQLKISRVAVKYQSFGFTSTDSLVSDPHGKDFKTLRSKAEEISDT